MISFLKNYKELNYFQIKRALSFLHRIFVKKEMEVLLFRVDILQLLHAMMEDSTVMPKSHPAHPELDQFIRHVVKKLTRRLVEVPALYVEVIKPELFSCDQS